MRLMPSARGLVLGVVFVAVGAWFLSLWTQAARGFVAFDIYQYWLPNMLYGLQRVGAGGSGLLWNPFQNCGQPSLGISSTGLLYPLNLLFFGLDSDLAMRIQLVANFAIAGIGMYALARELGAGRVAALCAALTFELGAATVQLNTWTPQVSDAYVWLPLTMLFCERILRAPSLRNVVGLGGSIAVSLLSGSPQIMLFTYQLIVLRVVFEYATRRPLPSWRTLAAIAAGLALGPLIDAVQVLPGIETAVDSVRGGSLNLGELRHAASLSLDHVRTSLTQRHGVFNPIILVPWVVASASWLRAPTRRRAVFYTLAGALYYALAFGVSTPLFALYLKLPFGALFREPVRFTWVSSFCLAALTGLGADAILRRPPSARRAVGALLCMAAAVAAFEWLTLNHLRHVEWVFVALVAAAAVLATRSAPVRRLAGALIIAGTAANLLTFGSPGLPAAVNAVSTRQMTLQRLLPDHSVYSTHADVFTGLREKMTAQDRVHIVHGLTNFALVPKIASLYQLPSIDDYEPQPSRRWAQYLVTLRTGQDMTNLSQFYYPPLDRFAPGFRKRLLDLAAVRYLIVDGTVDSGVHAVDPPLAQIAAWPDLHVVLYENRQALPRAFYVPRLTVEGDARRLLHRLAEGADDPRRSALIEAPPPSGFVGTDDGAGEGAAEFVVDEPERVVLRVQAPARGFLYLADQYHRGWTAAVNRLPTPIVRANHVFRAVEVPAGESIVEFRYTPASVRIGAAITVGTLAGLALLAIAAWRRAPPRTPGGPGGLPANGPAW